MPLPTTWTQANQDVLDEAQECLVEILSSSAHSQSQQIAMISTISGLMMELVSFRAIIERQDRLSEAALRTLRRPDSSLDVERAVIDKCNELLGYVQAAKSESPFSPILGVPKTFTDPSCSDSLPKAVDHLVHSQSLPSIFRFFGFS